MEQMHRTTGITSVDCPYCGETVEIVVDRSIEQQTYVEDCTVCCRPMMLFISVDEDGEFLVEARDENA